MLFNRSTPRRVGRRSPRLGSEQLENRNLMTGLSIGAAPPDPPPTVPNTGLVLIHTLETGKADRQRGDDDVDVPDCLIWDLDSAGDEGGSREITVIRPS